MIELFENGYLGTVTIRAVLKSQEITNRGDTNRCLQLHSEGQVSEGLEEVANFRKILE